MYAIRSYYGGRVEGAVGVGLDDRAMALAAADDHRRRAADGLAEQAVLRVEDVAGLGVMTVGGLFRFLGVALAAVERRDDDRHREPVVIHGVAFALVGLMALVAADALA